METSHLLQGPKNVMQARKKIGPKSVMERRLSGNKSSALSREVTTQLEKHFLANILQNQALSKWEYGQHSSKSIFKVWMNGLEQNGKPKLIANT